MTKTLYELTKEDWNSLFPIEMVDHNPSWKSVFEKEKEAILSSAGSDAILRVEHFGSSSIPSIKSKPYIDMLIEIPTELLFDEGLIAKFETLGYSYFKVPKRDHIPAYMSFGKGYRFDGIKEQIFHIHMCPLENIMWEQLLFRDYLNENEDRAKEYEALKVELAAKFRNDRGAYVLGKNDFIKETLEMIKSQE
ncbi:GrpB family protein [Algoriphagus aquimarinus]|uniref:GrpB domain, predicted nucleotidyltransferase, UPF0157 family n=1 Tax=Algoriphagus aquimarinus TaxID=237018 RepID=A0A1I0X8D9_9BACT|nr:GrpB family protein [Algoriphagus aquimarinus]SFA97292.1 GrpB domain, predicted nucleotidyltransferase, UPF0157 family [Algoriphagus aquimarinus]